jgi:hypothetical protein
MSLFFALRHRHIFHTSIAVAAILAEILTMILLAIPFQCSTSYIAWDISTYLGVAILSLMLLVLISLFIPHTLAAVISYVFASRMSHEFQSQSMGVAGELDPHIWEGRHYRFGNAKWYDVFGRWGG